jgi:hypothetical protein
VPRRYIPAFGTTPNGYPGRGIRRRRPPNCRRACGSTTSPGGTATITGAPARSARGKITARNQAGYTTQTLTVHISG